MCVCLNVIQVGESMLKRCWLRRKEKLDGKGRRQTRESVRYVIKAEG